MLANFTVVLTSQTASLAPVIVYGVGSMLLDIVFGVFILGVLSFGPTDRQNAASMGPPDNAGPSVNVDSNNTPSQSSEASQIVTDLAMTALSCQAYADPTPLLRAMLAEGLFAPQDRFEYSGYSCFELPDGLNLVGLNVNSVCGGVTDPAIAAENPDLYPSLADRPEGPYQLVAFGSDVDYDSVLSWYIQTFGSRGDEELLGVIDGMYTPGISENEVFCDRILADTLKEEREAGGTGQEEQPILPPPPPPPIALPPPPSSAP